MSLKPTDAVIVDAIRTPMARSRDGGFRHVRAEQLSACVIDALLARNPAVDPGSIDDLIWGCVNQTGEQGFNIARNAALLTRLPQLIPAQTVNRLCASSMTALHSAAQGIMSGCGETYIVGGVEHMGHVPMTQGLDPNPALSLHTTRAAMMMGATAELLARTHNISREEQDRFALRSHQRAHAARSEGRWAEQLIAVEGHDEHGFRCLIDSDEVIRSDTHPEALASLRPAFDPVQGTVTAGNASALSDGASALLVVSAARAQALGLEPMARVRAMSVTACDPAVMGLGPVTAVEKLLDETGLGVADIGLMELNEAFAAQALAVLKELQLLERLDSGINLEGGAIALGHPLGCSGARICTTLLHQMRQRDVRFGLATLCVGMGQGVATLFERLD